MRLNIRLNDYTDRDLIEFFSDYNVSSTIFLDVLYADLKNIPIQFDMPKKRGGECARRKRLEMRINDDELEDYVARITPGYRSEYMKTILREALFLFRKNRAFGENPVKSSEKTYLEPPKDILETNSRKIKRRGKKRTLYGLLGNTPACKATEPVKAEAPAFETTEPVKVKEELIETPVIEEDIPKSEVVLIKTEDADEKISETNTIPDVSPKEDAVPLTTLTNAFGENIEDTEEDEKEGARMLELFLYQ